MPRTQEALDAILRSVLEQRKVPPGARPAGQGVLWDAPADGERRLPSLPGGAATTVHRIKAGLRGARPPVWRRLEVPSDLPLSMLHEVLQTAFGWFDCHPHQFETPCGYFGDPAQEDFWSRRADESGAAIAQVAPAPRDRLGYVYDFRDDWRHDLVIEAVVPATPGVRYPRCTAALGAPPEEGCGGVPAFNARVRDGIAPSAAALTRQLGGLAGIVVPSGQ
ncbi:MAG TPA: plasmid pRiA4b ORF-3 family protein [Trebonia sp.]|nr:plasmid pRiA4b ORF-3 family protein [Trebonia sp.]